jgi:hypothetical protein
MLSDLTGVFKDALVVLFVIFVGGYVIARTLRVRGLLWTCAAPGFLPGFVLWLLVWPVGLAVNGACLYACSLGRRWHRVDLSSGGDHARIAESRLGMRGLLQRRRAQLQIEQEGWVSGGRMVVGRDENGMPVSIPVGYESGCHTLTVGATGSGKTVSEAWIAARLIDAGYGSITLDPKGDTMLRDQLERAAIRAGRPFLEWTPEGPLAYNPYTHGSDTEIADKALSGEHFTEPHYLRQAQRYLGHAVRVMHTAGVTITPASLMAHMDPRQLEVSTRELPEEDANTVQGYLDSLTDRQKSDLSGVRDRLSILAESDTRQWLNPMDRGNTLDLQRAVKERAVVYFRLDSDSRPLLSAMLAGAIVGDLVTLSTRMQKRPVPTVVLIDEFSAILTGQVARLFGRARTAGFSLLLATQELADVPESAEMIAQIAGSKPVWLNNQQTEQSIFGTVPSGRATRRRGYEHQIDPSLIKNLQTGEAALITPGTNQPPTIAQMLHPNQA